MHGRFQLNGMTLVQGIEQRVVRSAASLRLFMPCTRTSVLPDFASIKNPGLEAEVTGSPAHLSHMTSSRETPPVVTSGGRGGEDKDQDKFA